MYNIANLVVQLKKESMNKKSINVIFTKFNKEIINFLYKKHLIATYKLNCKKCIITVFFNNFLLYESHNFQNIKVISSPGRKLHFSAKKLISKYNKNLNSIISTKIGLKTIREIKQMPFRIGGESLIKL